MVDNSKYFKLLKQEENKAPYPLLKIKKDYFNKLGYLSNDEESLFVKDKFNDIFLEFNFEINRIIPSNNLNLLVIPILGKCNLNCKGCDAYAPLCKENSDFYSAEKIREDLQELKSKGFLIKEISIEGGEPFLHPDLLNVVKSVTSIYDSSIVTILTNGTLLKSYDETFYKELSNLNCKLVVDKYFDMDDFDSTIQFISNNGVQVELDGCVDGTGWFHRAPLNLIDKDLSIDTQVNNFVHCEKANNIFTMDRGFIYPCGRSASIKYFNKFFNQNLPDCGIDIFKYSKDEICKLLSSSCELCKYCLPLTQEKMQWKESSLDISEWADI